VEQYRQLVKEIAGGKVNFKNDDSGNIHQIVGKSNFETKKIRGKFSGFHRRGSAEPPATVKPVISSVTVNSTMGPGIRIKI